MVCTGETVARVFTCLRVHRRPINSLVIAPVFSLCLPSVVMLPDIHLINGRPSDWRTAGILNRTQTRLFVGRLSDAEIDHLTSVEGQHIRISVRTSDLQRALGMRFDAPQRHPLQRPVQEHYYAYLRMLASIPLGACVGNVICYSLALESRLIPAATCVMMILLVESAANVIRESRQRAIQHVNSNPKQNFK